MYTQQPDMQALFMQLGLQSSDADIRDFIHSHRGLNTTRHIEEAPFWNEAQAAFLRDALLEDAEWAEVIDQLNTELHTEQKPGH